MPFDVCIGVSEAELNSCAAAVYDKLYPGVFTGETQIDTGAISFTAKFDVQGPPVFDLRPAPARPDALLAAARDRFGADRELTAEEEALVRFAADSTSNFTVRLAAVKLKLTAPDVPPADLNVDVTAHCSAVTANGLVSFVLDSVTAAEQPDAFDQVVVEKFVLPGLRTSLGQLFAGFTLPSFGVPGVPLGRPAVALDRRRLIVLANVAGHGDPSHDPGLPWPDTGFFALLSQAALQAAASSAIASSGDMSYSATSGDDAFEAYVHFAMRLVQPVVRIVDTGLDISFSLVGSVGAGLHVLYVPIELSYSARSLPDPTAHTRLVPQGSELVVVETALQPFTIVCAPDGDVPAQMLSWMTEFIVQETVGALTPMVTAFLTGIRFASLTIPAWVEPIAGATVTMTPTDLSVSNVAGSIALTGSLRFA